MAKALKIGGAILGAIALGVAVVATAGTALLAFPIAASIFGVSAATLGAISAGLMVASSLLAPTPKAPAVSPSTTDRLQATIDLRTPRKIVFGRTALATDVRDHEYSNGQDFLNRFIVLASHRIHAVHELWFDDKLAWTASGGVQGDYAGWLDVTLVTEGSAANAITTSARMGASRRYTGLAYLYLRYRLIGPVKKMEGPFAQSIPSRVTVVGDAALVYDPRRDSSVGGSGPQRAGDQTTWAWDDDAARNPALQLLWYLLGWRIQNPVTGAWKLAVGKGIPPARIDIASFITAANACDEPVTKAAGGTEPRYRSDGIFSEADPTSLVIDNLKAAMNAVVDDIDGRIVVTVLHNDLAVPAGSLSEDDVLGDFQWDQTPDLRETFNVVRGAYTDPSTTSLYQQVDYPEVRIDSPDGIERVETINLPLVQSPSQAQRLAKQRLQRMLYSGIFSATFLHTAWRYQKNDLVLFTFRPLGWVNRPMRVIDGTTRVDGTVPLVLRVEHAAIYAWDADEAPAVQGVAPTTYNQRLSPIAQAIDEAASQGGGALPEELEAIEAAAALAAEAMSVADGKVAIFDRPYPPTAEESSEGDRWVDTATGNIEYRRVAGSGQLAIGGSRILLGGGAILLPWTRADDSRISQALIEAAGAQATADGKVEVFFGATEPVGKLGDFWLPPPGTSIYSWTGAAWTVSATVGATADEAAVIAATAARIAAMESDGILSRDEKPRFIQDIDSAQARWAALDGKAASFGGVVALRADLLAKWQALYAAAGALSPAYTNISVDSPIPPGVSFRGLFVAFESAYAALQVAITAIPLVVQWATTSGGTWHSVYAPGDLYQRQSTDGGATWGAAVRVVGEDGTPGSPGAPGNPGDPGTPGIDGTDGTYPSFVFRRASATPATPTATTTPPAGWSDAPPADDGLTYLWQSSATFRNAVRLTEWSTPYKVMPKGVQDDADQTALNQHSMNDLTAVTVPVDQGGVPVAGSLPATVLSARMLGQVDKSALASWAMDVPGGVTATINNVPGDLYRGVITITALGVDSATIVVRSTFGGVELTKLLAVRREYVAAPATGGGGTGGGGTATPGNPASATTFVSPGTSEIRVVMATLPAVSVGGGGTVALTASLSFKIANGDAGELGYMYGIWSHSADGGASWTDVGTETLSSPAEAYFRFTMPKGPVSEPGAASIATSKSGLIGGETAIFRIEGRSSDGRQITSVTGLARATPE